MIHLKSMVMLLSTLFLLLVTIVSSSTVQGSNGLAGSNWQLVSIDEQAVIIDAGNMVTLQFNADEVVGSAGCNSYSASYIVSGDKITFEPITRTRMACADDIMALEEAFLGGLQEAARYELSDTQLTITSWNGVVLRFASADTSDNGNTGTINRIAYYIAPDAEGVQQVFQWVLNGVTHESRQITRAATDVLTYSAAYDGLAVAYISDGKLWLQPIHTEDPEMLVVINAEHVSSKPVFSQDGQYIAYTDGGVWLLDLSTRETRQILEDVPLANQASNAGEFRIFAPEQFVLDADGSAAWLVVDVGIWEWNTSGLYNLATGAFQIIEDVRHTDLLPLYDNRLLIYGNNAIDGEPILRLAVDLSDLDSFEQVFEFANLLDSVAPFAEQAVEVSPATVRVFGSMIGAASDFSARFYFDYDLMGDELISVNTLPLPLSETGVVETGSLSPDGAWVPVYLNATWTETGSKSGQVVVLNVRTGVEIAALDRTVSAFQWQP